MEMEEDTTAGSINPTRRKMDWVNYHLACLVIMAGPRIGEKIPLVENRTVIGRQKDVEIPIEDTLISRRHAEIAQIDRATAVLRDLDSKNGTFCNEVKIREKQLGEGDLIRIGGVILKYVGPDRPDAGSGPEVAERSRRDDLTGLFDRGAFSYHLGRNLIRCKDLHSPLSIGLIGLDATAKIHEVEGRTSEDQRVKETAALIGNTIRPTDILARFGPDVFGLVLPLTNLMGARIVGERLRILVAAHPFRFEGRALSATVSVGMAERRGGIEDAAALIDRAEKGLERAKEMGPNLTYCFMEPT